MESRLLLGDPKPVISVRDFLMPQDCLAAFFNSKFIKMTAFVHF
jgi:hypothetical protein